MSSNNLVKEFLDVYTELINDSKKLKGDEQKKHIRALTCLKNIIEAVKKYDDLADIDKNIFQRIADKYIMVDMGED